VQVKAAAALFCSASGLFLREETGQDLIEYALVACLVALAAVASIKGIGNKLSSSFLNISSSLTSSV
jgi:pilus assembly protein Flp/PilA